MTISLIVAAAEDNAIGKANGLLWHLPNDMKFFKNMTWGLPVVMGRKTFEALKGKPLPGRLNIVISRRARMEIPDGVIWVGDLESALDASRKWNAKEVFVIGGGEIYRQAMSRADKVYLTRVQAKFPEADTHLEGFDEAEWKLKDRQVHSSDEKHAYDYAFEIWERK
jgi:dihydrofolate reductase